MPLVCGHESAQPLKYRVPRFTRQNLFSRPPRAYRPDAFDSRVSVIEVCSPNCGWVYADFRAQMDVATNALQLSQSL